MIEISDIAREKLQEVLQANPDKAVRVFIQGHG